jgi:hypothetical protein
MIHSKFPSHRMHSVIGRIAVVVVSVLMTASTAIAQYESNYQNQKALQMRLAQQQLLQTQMQLVQQNQSQNKPIRSQPITVLELFTSQGCSSCPPADKNLIRVIEQAEKKELPVYALSFHVDYWNRLGWEDPYSDAFCTKRQQQYAAAMNLPQVYTPQLIVNGVLEFLGSDSQKTDEAMRRANTEPATAMVELSRDEKATSTPKSPPKSIRIHFVVAGAQLGDVLNVALIQSAVENEVPKGENAGRQLVHRNVVRDFKILNLSKGTIGDVQLDVAEGLNLENALVIAYVQNSKTLFTSGASSLPLGDTAEIPAK